MELIHYGSSRFVPGKFMPIKNEPYFCKPQGGLWASPISAKFGWEAWCTDNNFGDLSTSFIFKLKDGSKVYPIENLEDLMRLPMNPERLYPDGSIRFYPDFETICQTYDAIHLTLQGLGEVHMSQPCNLYGWDCECVLIMNSNCLTF